ncbi:Phosphate-selective porin O and P [Polystyrenella longa]|uniref:Phosphate-selective porin O and P n=1 Tax=Polystyrenella longa TaxID=2528007 RepID=A0A518CMD5_9PLAN|nr:porin [Polystyrenella longa]QDU80388.1 Phosphate-selective porin O and P [Polystyrenella longa]
MFVPSTNSMLLRTTFYLVALLTVAVGLAIECHADEISATENRIEHLERELQLQSSELQQLKQELRLETSIAKIDDGSIRYDRGLILTPGDGSNTPFSLKVNGWFQFRHHDFNSHVESWTDNAGITHPVENRNAFDIERARLVLSGHVLDERLTYFTQIDGDTDGGHQLDFFDYYWAWKFDDSFSIQVGKRKVSASRQWLLGARRTRLIDRPMATDFFRPDRTVGIWAVGDLPGNAYYELMVGNGYRTANLPETSTDDRLTFAGTSYLDPLGDYGNTLDDAKDRDSLLVRVGHSFVYSPTSEATGGSPLPETNFIRLTDGTRLTDTGALAPGVTVSDVDIYFYSIDGAFKYKGWSFDAELYLLWLEQLKGDAALPMTDLMQHGFYVEGGRFLIPQKLDANARYSEIDGFYGRGREIAAGLNYYPLSNPYLRLSFDVTRVIDSPLQNTSSDILVGDDGLLFRTQVQAEF